MKLILKESKKKQKKGTLLGLTWDSNMTWKIQVAEVAMKFHDKVGGVMKLCHFLDFKHRKQLVDVTLVSQLSYGIELFSQGTEKQMKRL